MYSASIVDLATIDSTSGDLWLTISDHLSWEVNEGSHLVLLQNKLNAYLRFIETARTLLAEELGLRLVDMATKQQYPVVVRTEIEYRRAAKFGDQLRIEGWLERIERVRFWCGFRVVRLSDDELIATCRQMMALIEMPAARPLPRQPRLVTERNWRGSEWCWCVLNSAGAESREPC